MAPREAVVRVCQIGGGSVESSGEEGFEDEPDDNEFGRDKWSLVVAMCVRSKARSLRRSVAG
jgi:hypothetical protein